MPATEAMNAQDLIRRQLRLYLNVAEQRGMDAEQQRRPLRLSQDDWQRWLGVLDDAPMPPHPALPLMLRHLGYVTNRLDRHTPDNTAFA